MAAFARPPWTRLNGLLYLSQASLRGSRDNALATLAEIHAARAPIAPLTTALLATPPAQPSRATGVARGRS